VFERFTASGRQAVVAAQEEARSLKHNWIGTEHLLLGVLADPEGVAARVLRTLGVDGPDVRADVIRVIGVGFETRGGRLDPEALATIGIDYDQVRRTVEAAFGPGALDVDWRRSCRRGRAGPGVPLTPRAKKVLELSWREAKRLGRTHIGTEHVLLGMLAEGEGVAAEILRGRHVSRQRVVEELERFTS
jgi:ATP-dependent Clp protease ATP-binding subunit ClpA